MVVIGGTFMYFFRGSLPWQGLKAGSRSRNMTKISAKWILPWRWPIHDTSFDWTILKYPQIGCNLRMKASDRTSGGVGPSMDTIEKTPGGVR
ncbi:Tetratricopeptide repeat (TPR)-like superfamily protein [Zea mays]|uniref:Tetratricopeptide repeat (TPR)-like superfamily protein n=1 Tax=Zea mays TaxID=4577 RepID=A0A1D6KSW7_MAIZE|nr:Tetratricopeptide repeat (TPR)-like superfamily protein [Zea mays]ONM05743.1 Tetratricopeptide repeat (TPR)-like superfamily protein [Zea mays]ONM05756.1 Tetratricopeptide repeat (TPR)-like superfamily protein [Zea mays]ONM05758.1 Tetratricopeptide repeat (TPR)-like superfamily protein [Zea mays]ONM05763.1 Tetratricopeptide repeat (TPR)-like superfamily protein [Zea mays]